MSSGFYRARAASVPNVLRGHTYTRWARWHLIGMGTSDVVVGSTSCQRSVSSEECFGLESRVATCRLWSGVVTFRGVRVLSL